MKIIVVGDINVDVILSGCRELPSFGREVLAEDSSMVLGCASVITAAGLARLGNDVAFVGKVGRDSGGEFCLEKMTEAGMDVTRVIRDSSVKTGITVSISSRSDRALISYPGAMTALVESEIPDECLVGFEHMHLSSYFLHERLRPNYRSLFRRAGERGMTTSVDPAHDPSELWGPDLQEVLREIDVFLPNEVELRGISGCKDPIEGMRRLQNGRTLTVVKLGASGALALAGHEPVRQAAPPVQPIDPTGAGDSFNSGFLDAWLRRRPLQEALRLGVACGSYSTLGLGGTGHQANREQAEALLRQHGMLPA